MPGTRHRHTLDALYLCYWSLRDPLTLSQSVPVVSALASQGYRVGLVTFEQRAFALRRRDRAQTRRDLMSQGIAWYPLTYHRSPRVVSTVFDATLALVLIMGLRIWRGVRLLHARGSVLAAPAALAAKLTGAAFFYDADGPLSEEFVDAGIWDRESVPHRLTRRFEGWALRQADEVAALTTKRVDQLQKEVHSSAIVLPCAVDTGHFRRDLAGRRQLRAELGFAGTVLLYAGKWGGWYATEDMFDFVAAARRVAPDTRLLILTNEATEPFVQAAQSRGLSDLLVVRSASRDEMPAYLSSADAGLSFIHPFPSKEACSPVKNGEYLACGLPVVTSMGVGDYTDLITDRNVGVVVKSFTTDAYEAAARQLATLLSQRDLEHRCRQVAEEEVGLRQVVLPRYFEIYRRMLGCSEQKRPK